MDRGALRRALARCRGESGFALAEAVVAMSLFMVVAVGMQATLASSVAGDRVTRERTVAAQVAGAELETIRRMAYDSVGTVGGNPSGTLQALKPVLVGGFSYNVRTRVTYVDDPVPGGYITRANYKRVLVVVTETRNSRELARDETLFAPPTAPLRNRAIVRAQVVDVGFGAGLPVPGVNVSLEAGPSAPLADATEADGVITFAQLVPNPVTGPQMFYDLRIAAPAGFEVLREHVPPAAAVHVALTPGQAYTPTLGIYRPSVIYAQLRDAAGSPYLQPAIVTVMSSRGAAEYPPTSTGALTVSQLGGESIVPGLQYTVSARSVTGGLFASSVVQNVPSAYPTDLTATFPLTLRPYTTAPLTVRVRRANGTAVTNARVDVTGGPGSVLLTGVTPASGNVTLTVPVGNGYGIAAQGSAGEGTGQGTANVPTTGATVTVTVIP